MPWAAHLTRSRLHCRLLYPLALVCGLSLPAPASNPPKLCPISFWLYRIFTSIRWQTLPWWPILLQPIPQSGRRFSINHNSLASVSTARTARPERRSHTIKGHETPQTRARHTGKRRRNCVESNHELGDY